MLIEIKIMASTAEELRDAVAALQPQVTKFTVPVVSVPRDEHPAGCPEHRTVAASIPTPARAEPVPLSEETKARLDKMEAARTEAAPAPEPDLEKKPKGRPRKIDRSEVPVEKPEGGYGKQNPPANPDKAEPWMKRQAAARYVLQKVSICAENMLGVTEAKKFTDHLLAKYGDGKFTTVPQGNYEAMEAEALKGPAKSPFTAEQLAAAAVELDARLKQREEAGATS